MKFKNYSHMKKTQNLNIKNLTNMDFLKHKQGVSGSLLTPQSKFNEFVKFDQADHEKQIPGKILNLSKFQNV